VRGWLKAGIVDHFDFGWNIRLGLSHTAVSDGQASHSHLPGPTRFQDLIKPSRQALQRQWDKLRDIIQHHRGAPQAGLVYALNPVIQGWANYYQYCVAKHDFQILDNTLYHQLTCWARYRHPRKSGKWCYRRYWRKVNKRIRFSDGESVLSFHQTTVVSRFVQVQGNKSPGACPERGRGDGDWAYWPTWLGRDPAKPRRESPEQHLRQPALASRSLPRRRSCTRCQ
jgi:hypothetical protein